VKQLGQFTLGFLAFLTIVGLSSQAAEPTALEKLDVKKILPALRPKGIEKEVLAVLGEREGRFDTIAVRSDGGQICIGGMDGQVRLWDLTSLKLTGATPHKDVVCQSYFPSGKTLVAGDSAGNLRFWSIANGRFTPISTLTAHKNEPIWALQFSPDGKWLATAGADKLIKLWDASKLPLQLKSTLSGHEDRVRALVFTPDGKSLVSCSDRDKTIRIWDVTGKPMEKQKLTAQAASACVAVSPDGASLVAGGVDGVLRTWKLGEKAEREDDLYGGKGYIYSVAFAPDGNSILGLVKLNLTEDRAFLWDRKGEVRFESKYKRHIEAVAFDPGGKHIAVVHEASIYVIRIPD